MLLQLSNRKYPPFPLFSYFSLVVCLRCLLHHILLLITYTLYVLVWRSYSLVCILPHLIIIILQTYLKTLNLKNACQIYFVECVSKVRHIPSVIHYTICETVCFQFTHFPCDDWENIYTLSYHHHHQIGSMNYYPLFRVRSWSNGVRCMSFCIVNIWIGADFIPQFESGVVSSWWPDIPMNCYNKTYL